MRSGLTRSSRKRQQKTNILIDPFKDLVLFDVYMREKSGRSGITKTAQDGLVDGVTFSGSSWSPCYWTVPGLNLENKNFTFECLCTSSNWFRQTIDFGFTFLGKGWNGWNLKSFVFGFYNNNLHLAYSSDGNNAFNGFLFPWIPNNGQLYYVGLVRSGSDLRAYVNGVLIGETTIYNSIFNHESTSLHVGSNLYNSPYPRGTWYAGRITLAARNLLGLSIYPIVNYQ